MCRRGVGEAPGSPLAPRSEPRRPGGGVSTPKSGELSRLGTGPPAQSSRARTCAARAPVVRVRPPQACAPRGPPHRPCCAASGTARPQIPGCPGSRPGFSLSRHLPLPLRGDAPFSARLVGQARSLLPGEGGASSPAPGTRDPHQEPGLESPCRVGPHSGHPEFRSLARLHPFSLGNT